jgi:hypothetical protein
MCRWHLDLLTDQPCAAGANFESTISEAWREDSVEAWKDVYGTNVSSEANYYHYNCVPVGESMNAFCLAGSPWKQDKECCETSTVNKKCDHAGSFKLALPGEKDDKCSTATSHFDCLARETKAALGEHNDQICEESKSSTTWGSDAPGCCAWTDGQRCK